MCIRDRIERLTKETERLTKEIARCEGTLNNPNFVNKAPAAKVDAEKDKLAKYKEMMDKVKGCLLYTSTYNACEGRFLSNKFMTQLSGWMRKAKSVWLFVWLSG